MPKRRWSVPTDSIKIVLPEQAGEWNCAACGEPAQAFFGTCAIEDHHIPVCAEHDVLLNDTLLAVLGYPRRRSAIERYVEEDVGPRLTAVLDYVAFTRNGERLE